MATRNLMRLCTESELRTMLESDDIDTHLAAAEELDRRGCFEPGDCAGQLAVAQVKLQTIEQYVRNLGKATGDWSVASPILEIISGDY